MKLSLFSFLLIFVNSATLQQDTTSNTMQPMQSMVQLIGSTLFFVLNNIDQAVIPLVFQGEADEFESQYEDCTNLLWTDIMPQALSADVERLTATCQDANRTALYNTVYEDIAQSIGNLSVPCLDFFSRYQVSIRNFMDSVIDSAWQFDIGLTATQPQFSVPLDTVVNSFRTAPGFLANVDPEDQMQERVANFTAAINNLTRDVPAAELAERNEIAATVDTGLTVFMGNGNQMIYRTIAQFLEEASVLLCSVAGPPTTDSSGSSNS